MAIQITKDMIITDILTADPSIAAVLMASGMHCIGCIASQGETLEEACAVHGLDPDEILNEITDYLALREEKKAAGGDQKITLNKPAS